MSDIGVETTAGSLRERKKSATRSALRRAALELVADRGLAAVTADDIAAKADVSTRTFFNYFSSKEDAVCGMDPEQRAEVLEHVRRRPASEPPLAALRAAVLEMSSSFDANPHELLRRLEVTQSDPHLLAHYVSDWAETERQLTAVLAERRGTDPAHDRYAALVAAVTLAANRAAIMSWCASKGQVPLAEELAYHLDLLRAGLAEPTTNPTKRANQRAR